MSIRNLLIASAFFIYRPARNAESGRIIGDSIGVGVWMGAQAAQAGNVVSTAKNSVAIYSGAIMEQLRQAKEGETVFLSLGTNDAVGGALDVKDKVAAIVAEADKLRSTGLDRPALRAEGLGETRQGARRHPRRGA